MLGFEKDAMAALHIAPNVQRDGNSITKGYGDQSCDQRDKGTLRQKEEAHMARNYPISAMIV